MQNRPNRSVRRRRRSVIAIDQTAVPQASRVAATSLLLLGLVLGLAGGLYYAWIVDPVVFTDASPARLATDYRAEYIFLVSQSYAVDGDWTRAEQRLAALADSALPQTVATLLEAYLRQQRPPDEIRNLAIVAQKLGVMGRVVELFAPTPLAGVAAASPAATATIAPLPATPTPTSSPTPTRASPTATAVPTNSPTPTAQPAYRLLNQERICDPSVPTPRIEVLTWDRLLNPLPGVEVLVHWENGSDRFFTGFKPEQGADYGDFTMNLDTSYTVTLAEGSPEVSGLRAEPCENGVMGSWQLTFQSLTLTMPTVEETPETE